MHVFFFHGNLFTCLFSCDQNPCNYIGKKGLKLNTLRLLQQHKACYYEPRLICWCGVVHVRGGRSNMSANT